METENKAEKEMKKPKIPPHPKQVLRYAFLACSTSMKEFEGDFLPLTKQIPEIVE